MLIDEKSFSEDRNGKQSPKPGLEQTLAQSRVCSERTVPGAFSKSWFYVQKCAVFGSSLCNAIWLSRFTDTSRGGHMRQW